MTEAKEGEFTLVYNTKGVGHPVALGKDAHEALQATIGLISTSFKEEVIIFTNQKVIYKKI